EVHYLELLVDDGRTYTNGDYINGPRDRIHTAYPVDGFDPKYRDKYLTYFKFFSIPQNSNLISSITSIQLRNIIS
ncbi:MAG: hypothetical protein P8Y70_21005, partial [Candidatus Lokiarchaeota archaeon]